MGRDGAGVAYPTLSGTWILDTETTGLDWWRHKLFAFAVADLDGNSWYYDIRRDPNCIRWLRDQMARAKRIVAHNAKFDYHMLREAGAAPPIEKFECTQVRQALINEHEMAYGLDHLGRKYFKRGKVKVDIDKDKLIELPYETASEYALEDVGITVDLYKMQEREIESQDLYQVLALERRLMPHLADQEHRGIRIDVSAAEKSVIAIDKIVKVLHKELDSEAGFHVNPNPSGSIKKLFDPKQDKNGVWRAKDGTVLESTPAGKPSLGAEALKNMRDPMAMKVLRLRKYIKARDTFLKGHVLGHLNPKTGCVHTHINQTKGDEGYGTGTGRLSYNGPALQQIPNRDKEMAEMVRPVFLPDEGHKWCYGDLDQHEFRLFAHYTNTPVVIQMYRDNPDTDFHTLVEQITGIPRNAPKNGGAYAKQLNLGIVFSMGAGLLAKKMNLPYTEEMANFGGRERVLLRGGEEVMEVLAKYHKAIPGVRQMIDKASSIARNRGFVRTYLGRHLRFPDKNFVYKAAGLIYQGSSADLNKLHICNLSDMCAGTDSRMLLNVHDEYSFSIAPGETRLAREARRVVESGVSLRVPIRIDFHIGKNWWDATNAPKVT